MTSTDSTTAHRAWRLAFPAFFMLLAWVLYLYRDTAEAIVFIWIRSDTFTHGFMVPPIVAWLVWRRRQVLAAITPQPSAWGSVLLVGALLAWLLGDLVAVNALTQLALVAVLALLVLALLGSAVAGAIAFPLAFLFFAVPFGEFAMPQLMVWTADFTVLALRLSGIPVYREGLQFVIPSGNWSVVEACSGIRYLIASATVGTLFAYLNYQSTKRRVLFIIISIFVPVLANWLRAYLIVMLGHLSDNKLAAGVDHLIYGWVFFGVVIMVMFIIGARWAEPEPEPSAAVMAPERAKSDSLPVSSAFFVAVAMALAALVTLPHVGRWAIDQATAGAPPQLTAPVTLSEGWHATATPGLSLQPAFQDPSAQLSAAYHQANQTVGVYLGYYRQQNYSRKLVSSENVLVKTKDPQWTQVARGSRLVVLGGRPTEVRTAELRGSPVPGGPNEERLVAWQIYWINGTLTASDTLAKAYGAFYRLLGQGDDSAVIILYASKGTEGQGDAALSAFMQANIAQLDSLLQQTRSVK